MANITRGKRTYRSVKVDGVTFNTTYWRDKSNPEKKKDFEAFKKHEAHHGFSDDAMKEIWKLITEMKSDQEIQAEADKAASEIGKAAAQPSGKAAADGK